MKPIGFQQLFHILHTYSFIKTNQISPFYVLRLHLFYFLLCFELFQEKLVMCYRRNVKDKVCFLHSNSVMHCKPHRLFSFWTLTLYFIFTLIVLQHSEMQVVNINYVYEFVILLIINDESDIVTSCILTWKACNTIKNDINRW